MIGDEVNIAEPAFSEKSYNSEISVVQEDAIFRCRENTQA